MTFLKRMLALLLALCLLLGVTALAQEEAAEDEILVEDGVALTEQYLVEYGYDYSSTDEVALYLYAFGELPPNFLTKAEARDMGWRSRRSGSWPA